jgi:DNA-binding MarR family transcriptional regulator
VPGRGRYPPDVTESTWLTTEEIATWRLYWSVTPLIQDLLDRQLQAESGISHVSYSVLVVLSESEPQRLRMTDLAAQLRIGRSRLTYVVTQLEARGWVRREDAEADGRSHDAVLTPEGLAALERAAPGHVRTVRSAVFARITPEQVGQLHDIYEQLLEGLEEGPAASRPPWRR